MEAVSSGEAAGQRRGGRSRKVFPYYQWMAAEGIPVHSDVVGISDITAVPRAPWARTGCGLATFLELAGRVAHDVCAAPAGTLIRIDGTRRGAKNVVVVNGKECLVQDAVFVVLLRLIAARLNDGFHAKRTKSELGIAGSRNGLSRVRDVLASGGAARDGIELLEGGRVGRFRLADAVNVERVAWDALARHVHDGVAKVARSVR